MKPFKLKDIILSTNKLRKFIGNKIVFDAIDSNFKSEILDNVKSASKVLVLSPHPDDDVFGCGGSIIEHIKQGDNVKIIYLTDGSLGFHQAMHPTAREKMNMATEREAEARNAAAIMGVSDLVFWRFKDDTLKTNTTSVKLLQNLLKDYQPDLVYLPSFLDSKGDHYQTCKMFTEAIKKISLSPEIWSYEIWSPVFDNRLVKIDQVIEIKKKAIVAHKSQLKSRDYISAILCLNQYRAKMFDAGDYAEAFFSCNKELYLKLFDLTEFKRK